MLNGSPKANGNTNAALLEVCLLYTSSKAEFLKWFMPLLQALRDLGGSATPIEARKKIIENEHLSDEVVNETRGKTQVNKFVNEVAFARNYLVGAGYIDKSVRGVWTLTELSLIHIYEDFSLDKIDSQA